MDGSLGNSLAILSLNLLCSMMFYSVMPYIGSEFVSSAVTTVFPLLMLQDSLNDLRELIR